MTKISETIKELRLRNNFSQEYIAKKLDITRPTYVKIEEGRRDLTIKEAEKLASIFSLSLKDLLNGSLKEIKVELLNEANEEKQEMRISVPKENITKFKEVLLYILERVGARPNIGETALYKLLYFIDFDYYEKYEEQLIGAKYIKNHFGPTPIEFKKITDEMIKNGELEKVRSKHFQYEQKKYLPMRSANLKILSGEEIKHIDKTLNRLAWKNAKELSDYAHSDTPFLIHDSGEEISYESVFHRDDKHSQRNYDDEL